MITHDTKIRVWYKHTDQMGFVHHSNYICYYEEARSDLMRSMGLSYADMERKGIIMPILILILTLTLGPILTLILGRKMFGT